MKKLKASGRELVLTIFVLLPLTLGLYAATGLLQAGLVIVAAVAVGAILRPAHIWIVWIASIVPVALYVIWWKLAGNEPSFTISGDVEGSETPLSAFLEWTFVWGPIFQVLPVWVGRTVRNRVEHPPGQSRLSRIK